MVLIHAVWKLDHGLELRDRMFSLPTPFLGAAAMRYIHENKIQPPNN